MEGDNWNPDALVELYKNEVPNILLLWQIITITSTISTAVINYGMLQSTDPKKT
jgi:hypothetical protein